MSRRAKPREAAAPFITFDELPGAILLGARGRIPALEAVLKKVGRIERATGTTVHLLDADRVCGPSHAASALLHARRAKERGRAHARDAKVEVMVYASGQRQISKALQTVGLSGRTRALAIMIEGQEKGAGKAAEEILEKLKLERQDSVLAPSFAKLAKLGVLSRSPREEDLEALALETVAMVDVE